MVPKEDVIVAFDLYGTLLSTESIAKELSRHFGEEKAATVAATWRKYQLEYTWRLNSMSACLSSPSLVGNVWYSLLTFAKDRYIPFSTITQRSLHHTLSENNLSLSEDSVSSLMSAYDSLSTFPDVAPALDSLAKTSSITPVVFSNGTQHMVGNSVHYSRDLSPHSKVFHNIITIEEVKRFKPHPDVYHHLARKLGKSNEQMEDMWLVSGNPFDIVGAKAVGMKACWVDRAGSGWADALIEGKDGAPDLVVKSLGEMVEGVKQA
ncbi:MAG: hypothetical protein Q9201_001152 [Fulgogasparrea decipioides]